MSRADKISGLVMFLIFGAAFLYARGFPPQAAIYVFIVNGAGMALSAGLVVSSFVKDYLKRDSGSIPEVSKEAWIRIAVTTGAIILLAIMINIIGFVPSAMIFAWAMILFLYLGHKSRRYYVLALVISVSVVLIIHSVFVRLMLVPLP